MTDFSFSGVDFRAKIGYNKGMNKFKEFFMKFAFFDAKP